MKYLIVVTIAIAAVVAANEEGTHKRKRNDCVTRSGISQEQLKILNQREHTDDRATHEYVLCTLVRGGFFSEENGFNVEAVVAKFLTSYLDEGIARELTTKCLDHNEQGSTPAEWAYRGVSCLDQNKIEELLREARRKCIGLWFV